MDTSPSSNAAKNAVGARSFTAPDARVLAVNDAPTNLVIINGLLAPYKIQVDCRINGQSAADAAKQKRYDIVLIDDMMLERDGGGALRSIREYQGDVPIIALTAGGAAEDITALTCGEFSDFLPKPIDAAKLDALLSKWIPREKRIAANGTGDKSVKSDTGNAGGDDDEAAGRRKTIFLVDDDQINLMVGQMALSGIYRVVILDSAASLFEKLKSEVPDLILLDVSMPVMNGYEAIKALKSIQRTANIPVIFLTSYSDTENELHGLSLGAIDYIIKPFSEPLLLKRIELHLLVEAQKRKLEAQKNKLQVQTVELERQKEGLARFNSELQNMVEARTKTVVELRDTLLKTMAELVECRDDVTGGHIERTQRYLGALLDAMCKQGLYMEETELWDQSLLLTSAQLHDVGKISIKDNILNKPGKLTDEEFDEMKKHTVFGGKVIQKVMDSTGERTFLKYAMDFAMTHHEKWDGTGYPNGLKGFEIPLLGRIMAIADVYDALRSDRPYKKAFSHDASVKIISDGRGTQFDPALVDLFISIADKFDEIAMSLH